MSSADNAQGVAGIQLPIYSGLGFKFPSTLGNGKPVARAISRHATPLEPGVKAIRIITSLPIQYPTILPAL